MEKIKKYKRLFDQINKLTIECDNPISRMATIIAVLYHKMDSFYWVGYYLLNKGELQVGPYQGTLACLELKQNKGVCWHAINTNQTVIVPNVHLFEGHIACDTKSNSEIVIPLLNTNKEIIGVLDIDSKNLNNFDVIDAQNLEKINNLISHS